MTPFPPLIQKDSQMTSFPLHTIETAPNGSRPALDALRSAFGFIPNIAAAMATSPVLISGLTDLFGRVHGGSFSEQEIQVLLLTNAVANQAEWPIALHAHLAGQEGVPSSDVASIRIGELPANPRLAALSAYARNLIGTRGLADNAVIQAMKTAGFDQRHLLEVIAVTAASTIINYTANVTKPPIESFLVRDDDLAKGEDSR